MRLNTMGMAQDIHLYTQGVLNMDFSLASFRAEIKSGLFQFAVNGEVQGASLVLNANGRPLTISLQSPIYLSAALWDAAGRAGLSENRSLTISVFDPLTMTPQPVKITDVGLDQIEIMGAWQAVRKNQRCWLSRRLPRAISLALRSKVNRSSTTSEKT